MSDQNETPEAKPAERVMFEWLVHQVFAYKRDHKLTVDETYAALMNATAGIVAGLTIPGHEAEARAACLQALGDLLDRHFRHTGIPPS